MSSNIRVQRICQQCGEEFTAKTSVTKFCGDRCAKRAYKARKRAEKIEASNKETKEAIQQPIIALQAKEFMSIADVCKVFGLSRTSLWRVIKSGKLKTGKFGRRVIIRKADLQSIFQ
ncbi:MAG: helix-turn-helix domain-containing protein [Bacteroidota bacterium]